MIQLRREDPQIFVWWGTEVECHSAVARKERLENLADKSIAEATERLADLQRSWYEVAPTDQVRDAAKRLLRVHPLRAADALQLAAAIVAAEGITASLQFVSFDERLRAAASREGFSVI